MSPTIYISQTQTADTYICMDMGGSKVDTHRVVHMVGRLAAHNYTMAPDTHSYTQAGAVALGFDIVGCLVGGGNRGQDCYPYSYYTYGGFGASFCWVRR